MKKFLSLSLILAAVVLAVPSASALAATSSPQEMRQTTRTNRTVRRNERGRRVVTTTRITRVGRFRYRETIRTTRLPNGRTRTQVISRVRIR
jgi:hypothetical protein